MPNYEKKVKIVGTCEMPNFTTFGKFTVAQTEFFPTLSLIFKIKNYVFQKFAIFLYLQM